MVIVHTGRAELSYRQQGFGSRFAAEASNRGSVPRFSTNHDLLSEAVVSHSSRNQGAACSYRLTISVRDPAALKREFLDSLV